MRTLTVPLLAIFASCIPGVAQESSLDSIFAPLADAKSPGLAVLVHKNGQTIFERGYGVTDLSATLAKATASGATVLYGPYASSDGDTAIVQFPGGYIAEVHQAA